MPEFNIRAGDTDQTIYLRLRDSTTGLAKPGLAHDSAGATCSYVLPRAARAAISLVTQTVTGAHADGGFVEVDATNCKGLYRLDLPDAAIASGAYSLISIEFDDAIEETIHIPLANNVNVAQISGSSSAADNLETASLAYSAERGLAGTALPAAAADAAGGLPVSDGGGFDVDAILTRLTAARAGYLDNLNGHTPQTGDSFARIGSNGSGLTEVDMTTASADALAGRIELALLNEGDGNAVLQAIADAIANDWIAGDASPVAIASAVWAAASRTLTANTNLNDLDAAGIRAAVGLGSANMDTQFAASATATGFSTLTEADIRTAAGLASANLDSQLTAISNLIGALNNLSSSAVGDAVLDEVFEGTTTLRQFLRLVAAANYGLVSGAATDTMQFRDEADSKNRITATVDADGNRTAITLDKT